MTETKECSNCDKFMIKWHDYNSGDLLGFSGKKYIWKCSCGNQEEIKKKTFEELWEESNRGEGSGK